MNIWIISTFWCNEEGVLFLNKSFLWTSALIFLVCLRVQLLGHRVGLCLTLVETAKKFSKEAVPFYTLTCNT